MDLVAHLLHNCATNVTQMWAWYAYLLLPLLLVWFCNAYLHCLTYAVHMNNSNMRLVNLVGNCAWTFATCCILLTCMYMACNDCVRQCHNEHAACYKSVHSIRFVSLLPHFDSYCNTGEARMKMEGVDEDGMLVAAVAMGELPSYLGYVCWHGSCGASATQLRHKCDANLSVICVSPASAAACIISCGASALPHVRCAHE
jgi:hypothetical protein